MVVGADKVAQAARRMPFVASFCDICFPEAAISERSIRIITSDLERRGVGVIMIHAPSGHSAGGDANSSHRRVLQRQRLEAGRGASNRSL